MNDFNPERVAAAELAWWQAHNEKDAEALREGLERHTQALYGVGPEQAAAAVRHFVSAAGYHDRRDWPQAVEACEGFFAAIRQPGDTFDPRLAAELEIGWWKLHDELEDEADKSPLIAQFEDLLAHLYEGEPQVYGEPARLRAEATVEHDLAEKPDVIATDAALHWQLAGERLRDYYRELAAVLSPS